MLKKFMIRATPALLVVCAACSTSPSTPRAGAGAAQARASCGSSTVQPQASAAEVMSACGEPTYRDAWGGARGSAQGPDLAAVEEWYYNAGPQRPVQVLRFLDGRLISVNQDGYGFEPARAAGGCEPAKLTQGLSKYRLVQICGEPLTRQAYVVDPSFSFPNAPVLGQGNAVITGQTENYKPVYREDLAYRIDGSIKTVTVENGRILSVSDAARSG